MVKKEILLLLIILVITGCENNKLEGPYKVIKVIDGDTIKLNNSQIIRMSGINTPETGECYYQEARDKLTEMILEKDVFLEKDKTNTDKYGRQLRYVYIDNLMTNSFLVENGYARVFDRYENDTKKYEELKILEETAKSAMLGLWDCENKRQECLYVGSKNSKTYHKPDCKFAKKIKPDNLVCYRADLEIKGLNPCSTCL
ncbi:MAG: thermonuclease family protein [Nanoarchaeota archaeon]|nr:thermonuclease family protein [Nanoarchaeota archaeon]